MALHCLLVREQTSLTIGAAAVIVLDLNLDTIVKILY